MIFGIDVSSYQSGINMAQAAREGIAFCFAKIGQGSGIGDPRGDGTRATYGPSLNPDWPNQRDQAITAGLVTAGYWYVGNTEPPASQATRCKAAIGDPTLPLMLDWEDASGDWTNFLNVLAAMRSAGLRVRLGYCPAWYGTTHGMNSFNTTGLGLVSSHYPSMAVGTPAQLYEQVPPTFWAGYGGAPGATILQFAASATVAGRTVDANAYPGSRDQLAALLTPPAPPAPRKVDPVTDIPLTVNPDGTFQRTVCVEAGASSQVIANAWITFGVAWGGASFTVSCLDGNGVVMPGQKSVVLANNRRDWVAVPSGAVLATIQGKVSAVGAKPAAAVVGAPK